MEATVSSGTDHVGTVYICAACMLVPPYIIAIVTVQLVSSQRVLLIVHCLKLT